MSFQCGLHEYNSFQWVYVNLQTVVSNWENLVTPKRMIVGESTSSSGVLYALCSRYRSPNCTNTVTVKYSRNQTSAKIQQAEDRQLPQKAQKSLGIRQHRSVSLLKLLSNNAANLLGKTKFSEDAFTEPKLFVQRKTLNNSFANARVSGFLQ